VGHKFTVTDYNDKGDPATSLVANGDGAYALLNAAQNPTALSTGSGQPTSTLLTPTNVALVQGLEAAS
jgi:hypothetical protein